VVLQKRHKRATTPWDPNCITIIEEYLDLQKQVRMHFHCFSLLETIYTIVLHFSDLFNVCRSLPQF
jgi:hypothetical protein